MPNQPAQVIKPLPPGFQRTMIVVTALFISLMAAIDLTIVAVALPYMAGSLNATADEVTWVVTMFAVGQAVVIGTTGHLSRLLGRKTLIFIAVIGFVGSSAACGLAQDLDMIVLFRFIQGLFSGPLIPLSQSMLIDAVEEKDRAKIMTFWLIGALGGPALGPLLGGYLAQDLDWRWNFWVNLPVGVIAIVLIVSFVRTVRPVAVRTDWLGLILLLITLSSLQIGLNQGDKLDWFSSHTIVYLFFIATVAAAIFIARGIYLGERNIVDITLFRDLNYSICCLVMAGLGCVFLGLMILTPILFVDLLGWQASTAGFVIGCYGIGGITGSFVSGRLQAFLSFRQIYILSCVCMGIGWLWFSRLNGDMGLWQGVPPGVMVFFGMMAVVPVLAARAFANLPVEKRDDGAGIFNLTKTLGLSFGTTAVGSLYYIGQQANWARFAGDVSPSNPVLTQYLDRLGANADYDVQVAYVATLLQEQTQLLTVFEIAEYLAAFTFGLAVLAVFFGEKQPDHKRGLAGWFRLPSLTRYLHGAAVADTRS